MRWANEHGFGELVPPLLDRQARETYISHPAEFVLVWVAQKGSDALFKMLLADKRIDASLSSPSVLSQACRAGRIEIVKLLLADERVDPSADNQSAIRVASVGDYVEIVKLLLADKRVDPSVQNQHPIIWASYFGNTEVVKVLLADPRVDPSVEDHCPLRSASENGHAELVKLLLADKRVDPSVRNQAAITSACQFDCVEVAKLLLADQRVDISRLPCPSSSQIAALFSLRRSFRLQLQRDLNSHSDLRSVLADVAKIEAQRKALLDDHLLSDLSNLCLDYVPDLFCHLDAPISSLVLITDNSDPFPRFSFGCLSTL
jgi:hypothetical protein